MTTQLGLLWIPVLALLSVSHKLSLLYVGLAEVAHFLSYKRSQDHDHCYAGINDTMYRALTILYLSLYNHVSGTVAFMEKMCNHAVEKC